MKLLKAIAFGALLAASLEAQLTPVQKEQELVSLANVFAKRYAPANWKIQALGVNVFEISPWIARARATRTDIEFLEICAQYVSSLQDGHTQFVAPGNFVAELGFFVDLYEGKVLIDGIDTFLLPPARYPLAIGDEIVSLDGRPVGEWIQDFARLHTYANPRFTLRVAADALTFRQQSFIPSAGLLGESARVRIRKQDGTERDLTIPWTKQGTPITRIGALPGLFSAGSVARQALADWNTENEIALWEQVVNRHKKWRMQAETDPIWTRTRLNRETGETENRRFALGYGVSRPVWDLPAGFAIRQGRFPSDYFFSGTYQAGGKRIGYLRIGAFDDLTVGQTRILDNEIDFLNQNTDGLVVDVMRNPGGGCSLTTIAQRLIPGQFTHFAELIRPSFELIAYYDELLLLLEILGASQNELELYRFERGMLLSAYRDGRGLTGPIPSCAFDLTVTGTANAYRKPMILLVDDFSTSAADIFAAVVQDNGRAKLVGVRTSGAGGRVELVSASPLAESRTTNTASIVTRAKEYEYAGFPKSPFIENVGVRPDIELDYMTMTNLLRRGSPFVEEFTKIILAEIARGN